MDSDGGGGRRRGVRWEDGMGRNRGAPERRWREDSRFGRAGQERESGDVRAGQERGASNVRLRDIRQSAAG
jgi:hypothetical protein